MSDSPSAQALAVREPVPWREIEWLSMTPFLAAHLVPFAAMWTGVRPVDVLVAVVLYVVRMFAVTAGYHRYFAHRTFKTSRLFQFLLAFLAQTSSQRGVLWWAAHHRVHHKESDGPGDVHSPVRRGFLYAHVLWIYHRNAETRTERIKDFARYPELRFLDRYWLLPPVVLGLAVFLLFGWSGLVIGFFASTVALWHGTFLINSLTHVWGSKRFDAGDESRNNALFALVTLGEGWHNNHHYYQSATRQGFYWWEVDVTYYVLRMLSLLGIVRDLREPPERVLQLGRRLDAERRAARRARRRGLQEALDEASAGARPRPSTDAAA